MGGKINRVFDFGVAQRLQPVRENNLSMEDGRLRPSPPARYNKVLALSREAA